MHNSPVFRASPRSIRNAELSSTRRGSKMIFGRIFGTRHALLLTLERTIRATNTVVRSLGGIAFVELLRAADGEGTTRPSLRARPTFSPSTDCSHFRSGSRQLTLLNKSSIDDRERNAANGGRTARYASRASAATPRALLP